MNYGSLWYIFVAVYLVGIAAFAIAVEHLLMWFLPRVEVWLGSWFWWALARFH